MTLSRGGGIAVAVTGALLAVTVASPAVGGPSLKALVKKEVAKQISKATGPPGATGAPGPQGAPGPTAAGVSEGGDPVPNPDFLGVVGPSATLNAPTSGRILVMLNAFGNAGIRVDCSTGTPNVGLYVDGVRFPIPEGPLRITPPRISA